VAKLDVFKESISTSQAKY